MNVLTNLILRRVIFLIVLQLTTSLSITIKKLNSAPNIVSKRKMEFNSVMVDCFLNDIISITMPTSTMDQIYLTKPNGEIIKIDTHILESENNKMNYFLQNGSYILPQQSPTYVVIEVKDKYKKLKPTKLNEFLIGPLLEEDHGNWMLSIFTEDNDGDWIERFQTFTVVITELITLKPQQPVVHIGNTFNLNFAYPIPAIELCEIVPPRSTYDRFYDRDKLNFNKCGFLVPNITKEDEGTWKIIGVGRMVYMGEVQLNVIDYDNKYISNNT